jgi:tryptophanyl-tRNA synthetase
VVPVGKDQKQHIEMARDIASSFNHQFGDTFVLPESRINEQLMTIPGTDGQKMSKSYGNIIDIFQPDKKLRKNVMAIITDSTPLEEPKNPETCNVFALYSLLANELDTVEMRKKYLGGNYGYGHAKQALFELIIQIFGKERSAYDELMANPQLIEDALAKGEERASKIAHLTLDRVRRKLGF